MTDTFMDHYLHVLYPTVDVKKTPLPSSWSCTDKSNYLKLSDKKLRAHYTGYSQSVKDTSCVRSDYPIPLACGLYYFEVKVIDKGLKCCIAIGIGTKQMKLHKLPGMQKNSFGYFGCSGGIFWGSDVGKNYGPPFTTDDIIGCGVNLVDREIFYTRNGKNLGQTVFGFHFDEASILALYPTVGLQTKGEVVQVNFGQSPFVYNIEKDIKKLKTTVASSINDFPLPNKHCELDTAFRSIVSSYLVHQGYSSTAEAFAQSTDQEFGEEKGSIESRKQILDLVLNRQIEEAINTTVTLYPTLFDSRPNLLFLLKVHHFVEMIGTLENKVRSAASLEAAAASLFAMQDELQQDVEMMEPSTSNVNLETMMDSPEDDNLEIEIDMAGSSIALPPLCNCSITQCHSSGEDSNRIMRITELGKELLILNSTLGKQGGVNDTNNDLLAKAFSLMSYTRCPSKGPRNELNDPAQREMVADALNSAILETIKLPGKSALHLILGYARELTQLMDKNGIGASAFADVDRHY